MPDEPKASGAKMPQKRNRKEVSIFVIAGKASVTEYKNLDEAEKDKAMKGTDFVVIRGNRLEKKVTVKYL